jgi:galactokinase
VAIPAAAADVNAAAWFAEAYGREPDGLWFAPGRVNLMGGRVNLMGPDYTEAFVLPFALGAGVTAAAARRSDRARVGPWLPGGEGSG